MPYATTTAHDPLTGITFVRAHGEIDLTTAPELRRAIAAAIWDRPEAVVIDLTGVDFMDSSCVHVVLTSARQAANAGVELELRRPDGPRGLVFDMCGLRPTTIALNSPD